MLVEMQEKPWAVTQAAYQQGSDQSADAGRADEKKEGSTDDKNTDDKKEEKK